jgi:hypothetical protein
VRAEPAVASHPGFVTVVSGLPRSGTSLMMKMLEAGGLESMTDGLRAADEDNPRGYYELERVKQLPKGDTAWVADARGKVVKVISALLEHLPTGHEYRIIFMRRRMEEVLASQRQMLVRRGKPTDATADAVMASLFDKHLKRVATWLASRPEIHRLDIDHAVLMAEPAAQAARVAQFLGGHLDVARMAGVVDASLHRQRAGDTGPATANG